MKPKTQIEPGRNIAQPLWGRLFASRRVGLLRVLLNGTRSDMVEIRLTFHVILDDTAQEDDILPYKGAERNKKPW